MLILCACLLFSSRRQLLQKQHGVHPRIVQADTPVQVGTGCAAGFTHGADDFTAGHFLIGHNERPVEGEGADDKEGFAIARNALENENYQVHTLLLAAKGEVPEDADVVMMLRLQKERMDGAFIPSEREYFHRFGLDADNLVAAARRS